MLYVLSRMLVVFKPSQPNIKSPSFLRARVLVLSAQTANGRAPVSAALVVTKAGVNLCVPAHKPPFTKATHNTLAFTAFPIHKMYSQFMQKFMREPKSATLW